MAKLLPFRRSDATLEPREPRLVELDDDTADDVFAALSAGTARDILKRLYRDPGTATDVAEAADTSLQNARYHLDKLQSAGLVEEVDTWYSSRGTEMTVYAPTNEPLVVAAGPDEQTSVLRSALGRLVGSLGVLGIASLVVDRIARSQPGVLAGAGGADAGGDGGDGAELVGQEAATEAEFQAADVTANASATTTPTATEEATQTATDAAATGTPMPSPTAEPTTVVAEATQAATPTSTPEPMTAFGADPGLFDLAGGLPPGALFFLGGLVVLGAVAGWWYFRSYRPLYG
ncbi:MAG: helix-turn-helix domain-containing protein [Halobacteriales archaeon]|nr:helix-turn-helix domain-containing protein [Halobacteriales archaeon]